MRDPFGAVLTLIRDDPAVAAIVAGRVSSHVEGPPSVQLIDNATSRRPFGAGSGRMGMQSWTGFARCWGPDSPTGAILSRQLAGAVSDALHNHRPTTVGTTYIARAYAPEIDGTSRDPDTKWPYADVRLEVHAGADAVA